MSQAIKAFLGIFFLMMLMLLGCEITGAQMSSVYARDYKAAVMAEISDSGCNQNVIDSCVAQAREDGYDLDVLVWEQNGHRIAEVTLEYEYRISFLNYTNRYKLRGYAV